MASRFKLNPAFAKAHGIGKKDDKKVDVSSVSVASSKRIDVILKQARATGKLNAANAGLTSSSLPDEFFDLRAGITLNIDLSLASSSQGAQINFVEETLTLVDVSDNNIGGTIDKRFTKYECAQTLRLRRCGFTNMIDLSMLESLIILDLSANNLVSFDFSMIPPTLKELNLSSNKIETVFMTKHDDRTNNNLYHLISLDVSENNLTTLSDLELVCKSLQTLRCHHNRLQELPNFFITAQDSLQILDAAHNRLSDCLDLSSFNNLHTILLAFNQISKVPCISLSVSRLDLTTNKLETIEGLFVANKNEGDPSSLADLLLQDNYLTELDAVVVQKCQNLQRLDLSSNKLKTLPYQLGFLTKLQTIHLSGNPLFNIKSSDLDNPRSLLQVLRNRAPKSKGESGLGSHKLLSSALVGKNTINLVGKSKPDLEQLTREIQATPSIAFEISGGLLLDSTQSTSIPDDLPGLLPNINEMSFQDNPITALPKSLATSCQYLTRLRLANAMLTTKSLLIFDNVESIPWSNRLVLLDLSANRLQSFPVGLLRQLVSLESLNLSRNQITSVQGWNWLPGTLSVLNLSDNKIDNVDGLVITLVAMCPKLSYLSLLYNDLKKIPYTIGFLAEKTEIKFLDLKGNPQQNIRYEILEKNCLDLLTYLKSRMTQAQVADMTKKIAMKIREFSGDEASGKEKEKDAVSAPSTRNTTQSEVLPQLLSSSIGAEKSKTTVASLNNLADDKATGMNQDEESNNNPKQTSPLLEELKTKVADFEQQLDNPSLSTARRYAMKKSLAMERSKLIREERRLGLRK